MLPTIATDVYVKHDPVVAMNYAFLCTFSYYHGANMGQHANYNIFHALYLNGEQLVDLLVWPVNQYKIFRFD